MHQEIIVGRAEVESANTQRGDTQVREACRVIAEYYNGKRGIFAYEAFDYINATFFNNELPMPLILWTLTDYGVALGNAYSRPKDGLRPPIINLHPATLLDAGGRVPWGLDSGILGVCFAYEVLLHECIHLSVYYRLGGEGEFAESAHNCTNWCAETNRIAPMLGLEPFDAQITKVARVPIEDAPLTVRGKKPTELKRVTKGNVPLDELRSFPHATRYRLGKTDYYHQDELPFTPSVPVGDITHAWWQ